MTSVYEKAPSSPSFYDTHTINSNSTIVQSPIAVTFAAADGSSGERKESSPAPTPQRPTPTRKYSVQWVKYNWEGAVRAGTLLPRLVYSGVVLLLIVAWILVTLAFTKSELDFEKQNAREITVNHSKTDILPDGAVGLKGQFINFDAAKHSLTVSWSGIYRADNGTGWTTLGDYYDPSSVVFDEGIAIFRDLCATKWDYVWNETSQTILRNGSFNPSLTLDEQEKTDKNVTLAYMYRVHNASAIPTGILGVHPWDSFDTDITFTQLRSQDVWVAPLMGYPFDLWSGSIVFVASDLAWVQRNHINGGNVFEIANVMMTGNTLNWRFSFEFDNTCKTDQAWDYRNPDTFHHSCHLQVNFVGRRPPMVIFAAVSAVIVNWTSALFIFILTCEAIIMRRKYMLSGTDILSVCFTALFALPTIRSLLPGAPEYGMILDLVGVLPCTILIALCTVAVAVAKLNKRRKEENKDE